MAFTFTSAPVAMVVVLLLLLLVVPPSLTVQSSPYYSDLLFPKDFERMLNQLKVYAYSPIHNSTFPPSSPASIFHHALLRSPFLTTDPHSAHLFYLSSPSDHSRHLARAVRTVRSDLPFWNRALGADHFYLTDQGVDVGSDRNLLELFKNSIRISPFPSNATFVPHKDLALPPTTAAATFKEAATPEIDGLVDDLSKDPGIYVDKAAGLPIDRQEAMSASRFCVLFYDRGDGWIGEALRVGCVPVVVSGRAVVDLPFGDVLRWSEMALVVRLRGGAAEVRRAMRTVEGERYDRMRAMGMKASEHFRWSGGDDPSHTTPDAFLTVMYQLWRRRHVIRYTAWDVAAQ